MLRLVVEEKTTRCEESSVCRPRCARNGGMTFFTPNDHPDESSHSDFEVTQTLSCPGLGSSQALATPITTRFSGIEHLGVQWVWPEGQGSARLGPGQSTFELRSQ